jgi:hypothetical protein
MAGRRDVDRLAGQLISTEDKLERLLQAVERLKTLRARMRGEPRARGFVAAAIETANIVLTAGDARIGATPRDLIWTHQRTALYRYRSADRRHAFRCCSSSR